MRSIVIKSLFLLLAFTAAGCSQAQDKKQTREQAQFVKEDVDVAAFADLVRSGKGLLVDVRTPEEFAEGHIAGATNMDIHGENFEKQLGELDKGKAVYVYCRSGGRSGRAAGMMHKLGFAEVYNLSGGITAWADAGEAVSKE